jgi:hypothetical protein
MYKESIYQRMYEKGESVLHKGYDPETQGIVNRFFSSRMMMSPLMEGFLKKIEPYFVQMINSVKKIQFYQNYTVDKNDTTLNK